MLTDAHWAIVGQAFVFLFAIFGMVAVVYLTARELDR